MDSTPSLVKQPDFKHPKFGPLFTDFRLGLSREGDVEERSANIYFFVLNWAYSVSISIYVRCIFLSKNLRVRVRFF